MNPRSIENCLVGQEWIVTGLTSNGAALHANGTDLTPHVVIFELFDAAELRLSEVLTEFKIIISGHMAYKGRAVIRNLIDTGLGWVCEAALDDPLLIAGSGVAEAGMDVQFDAFMKAWQGFYRVDPLFKVVVADAQTFLGDLRLWLQEVELGIRLMPLGDQRERERAALNQLEIHVLPVINSLHRRFEEVAEKIEEPLRAVHQTFARRMLHPLFMCSPFGRRAFHKPLGYAGDYEMVNMIMRDPFEGASLFAKVMNLWLLRQFPSEAHRNRLEYLEKRLNEETLRVSGEGRNARILNVACGPAFEIQRFIRNSQLADKAEFTLIDFNEETIERVREAMEQARRSSGRATSVQLQKRSVLHLLKDAVKSGSESAGETYDFIYCAGLFDYLADRTCTQLIGVFQNMLAPGGLIAVTNVDACKPFRQMLEFLLDWHLIYRNPGQMQALALQRRGIDHSQVTSDATGVNLFLELRRS